MSLHCDATTAPRGGEARSQRALLKVNGRPVGEVELRRLAARFSTLTETLNYAVALHVRSQEIGDEAWFERALRVRAYLAHRRRAGTLPATPEALHRELLTLSRSYGVKVFAENLDRIPALPFATTVAEQP